MFQSFFLWVSSPQQELGRAILMTDINLKQAFSRSDKTPSYFTYFKQKYDLDIASIKNSINMKQQFCKIFSQFFTLIL